MDVQVLAITAMQARVNEFLTVSTSIAQPRESRDLSFVSLMRSLM